jgi:glucose/arabinose dehydrogenase
MKSITVSLCIFFSSVLCFSQAYIIEQPLTGVNQPVDFAFFPGTSKVFVNLKLSSTRVYDLSTNTQVSIFWNFTDTLNSNFERGVLGVCVDPNFASNRYVYVYYVHSNPPNSNTNQRIRIVRFTENNNLGTNSFLVLDHPVTTTPPGNHFGGIIRFRPSDPNRIYFVIGEIASSSNAQLLTNPYGKVLRINRDGTIPTDNPFYDDGNPYTGNDDRIWTYGLRNSFGFCFSPINDSLYESENGANTYDECNIIIKGRNYGWPSCEGFCSPYNPAYKQPLCVFPTPLPALAGILVYNGTQMPWLNNKLIVGSNNSNGNSYIYQCNFNGTNDSVVSKSLLFNLPQITTILQGTDGYIYAMNGGYTSNGKIYRIRPDNTGIINNNGPAEFVLEQNYPNPFNPSTSIKYSVAKSSYVVIKIYDILGHELRTLVNESKLPGNYDVDWDGSDYPTGIYVYRLFAGDFKDERKMVLLK